MENQNTNKFNGSGQNNNRRPENRTKPQGQDKRPFPEKSNFSSRDRNPNGSPSNAPGQFRPKEQRSVDKAAPDNQNREKAEQRFPQQQNRFPRSNPPKPAHESFNRTVKVKREETVEDIKADIERVDKDIQFEMKQIKSIKLGL